MLLVLLLLLLLLMLLSLLRTVMMRPADAADAASAAADWRRSVKSATTSTSPPLLYRYVCLAYGRSTLTIVAAGLLAATRAHGE
jgi:hypothetical protein